MNPGRFLGGDCTATPTEPVGREESHQPLLSLIHSGTRNLARPEPRWRNTGVTDLESDGAGARAGGRG